MNRIRNRRALELPQSFPRKPRSVGDRTHRHRSRRHPPSDGAMRYWLNTFSFFHSDTPTCTPAALRMDAGLPSADSLAGSQGAQSPAAPGGRYVFEVALYRNAHGERWTLVCWEVDVPGILYCDCADWDEALALFAEPSKAAGRRYGVRLRRERRPW